MKEVDQDFFNKNIYDIETEEIKSDKFYLVDFYADWCRPCKAMLPVLEALSEQFDGVVEIVKLNSDNNKEIMKYFSIASIPTLLFINNSTELVVLHTGVLSKKQLNEKIREVFKL